MTVNRLKGLDAIFLAAETPNYPLHIMAIMLFDPSTVPGGYGFEGFRRFVADQLPALTPLRRRLVEVPLGLDRPTWVEERNIDMEYHVRRAGLPSPGSLHELSSLASEIAERRLDRSRPLWEMVVVEGLAGGNVALIVKLHHAMMDGATGVNMMASLFNSVPEIPPPPVAPELPDEPVPGALELLARALPEMALRPARTALAAAHAAQAQLRVMLEEQQERAALEEDEGPKPEVPRSLFNVRTTPRRVAACTAISLDELRTLGHAFGATVNDALLTVVGGAIREYLLGRDALPEHSLVAGVPVSTHKAGREEANAISSLYTTMGTDIADPAERIVAIRDASHRAKRRQGAVGGDIVKEIFEIPAPWVFAMISTAYSKLGISEKIDPMLNLVVSNVPGPPAAFYFGGMKLVALHPLGPIFDGLALNITAISTGDRLSLGLVACRGAVPDLWTLADAIPAQLAALASRVPGDASQATEQGGDAPDADSSRISSTPRAAEGE